LKNKEKRKNKLGDDGKAVASSDSYNGDVLIAFASCVSMNAEWILDYACSYHVCINKDWLVPMSLCKMVDWSNGR
jgi:hypothetical protein